MKDEDETPMQFIPLTTIESIESIDEGLPSTALTEPTSSDVDEVDEDALSITTASSIIQKNTRITTEQTLIDPTTTSHEDTDATETQVTKAQPSPTTQPQPQPVTQKPAVTTAKAKESRNFWEGQL